MPVRSLRLSVPRWRRRDQVLREATAWAQRLTLLGLIAVGACGSYAPGDAGVGSDLDLLVIVESCDLSFECRMA